MSPSPVAEPLSLSLTFASPFHVIPWDARLLGEMTGQKPRSETARGAPTAGTDTGEGPTNLGNEDRAQKEDQGGDKPNMQIEKDDGDRAFLRSGTSPEAESDGRGEESGLSGREDRPWERGGFSSPHREKMEDGGPEGGLESPTGQHRNILKTENLVKLMLQEIWNVAKDCKEDLEEDEAGNTSDGLPSRRLVSHTGGSTRRRGTTQLTTGELSGAATLSDLGDDEGAGGSTEKLVKHLHSYLTEHLLPAVEKAKAEVEALRRNNRVLSDKLKRSEALVQRQSEQLDELQEDLGNRSSESQRRKHLSDNIEKLKTENAHLRSQLDVAEQRLKEEHRGRMSLEQKFATLERRRPTRADSEPSETAELREALDSTRREVKRLTTLTAERESMIRDLKEVIRLQRGDTAGLAASRTRPYGPLSTCSLSTEGGYTPSAAPFSLATDLAQKMRHRMAGVLPQSGFASERLSRRREHQRMRRGSGESARSTRDDTFEPSLTLASELCMGPQDSPTGGRTRQASLPDLAKSIEEDERTGDFEARLISGASEKGEGKQYPVGYHSRSQCEKQFGELTNELKELKQNHAQLQESHDALRSRNEALEKEAEAARSQSVNRVQLEEVQKAQEEAVREKQALEGKLESVKLQLEEKERQLVTKEAEDAAINNRLEQERDCARREQEEAVTAWKAEIEDLKKQLRDAQETYEALTLERDDLRQELTTATSNRDAIKTELANVRASLHQALADAAAGQGAKAETELQAARLAELEQQVRTAEREREELEKRLRGTSDDNRELARRFAALQATASREAEELQKQLEKANEEKVKLVEEKAEREKNLTEKEHQLSELETELQKTKKARETERAAAEAKLAALQETSQALDNSNKETAAGVQAELEVLKVKQEVLTEEAQVLLSQVESSKSEKRELTSLIQSLTEEKNRVEMSLDEARTSREEAVKAMLDLQEEQRKVEARLSVAAEEIAGLKRACSMLREELATAKHTREKEVEAFRKVVQQKNDERKKQVRQMLEVNENLAMRKEEMETRLIDVLQDARNDIYTLVKLVAQLGGMRRGSFGPSSSARPRLSSFANQMWQSFEAKVDSLSAPTERSLSVRSARKTHRPVDMYRPVALSIQNLVPQPKAGPNQGRRSGSSDSLNDADSDLLDFFPELVVKIRNKLFQDDETPMSSFRQHPPQPPSDSSDESEGEGASARATFRAGGSDSSGGRRSSHLGVQKNRQLQSIKPDPASGLSSPILAMWEPNVEVARQTSQNTTTPPRQTSEQAPSVDIPVIHVQSNGIPDLGQKVVSQDRPTLEQGNASQTLLPMTARRSKRPVSLMKYNDPDKSTSRLK
ncbi:hypothetical protein CSUI_005229 [Cystoisospora suis]|uniref:Uncharacterized protein n=1 Tax=Cystoisospora suis TaxID=483139 RepID=A0A2C6KUI1_9APIC|nr:hypothetical protein CSUI_005229 [Cystoisospora suis]